MPARAFAAVILTTSLLAGPAVAADDIVAPAATPPPSAGPTVSAAQEFCGTPVGKADALIAQFSGGAGLKEVYKSDQYVAFSDDKTTVMYTFTTKDNPAHPAAVCRRPVQDGDTLTIKMSVVCDGGEEACNKLRNDFNVMTAKMQADVNTKIKDGGK